MPFCGVANFDDVDVLAQILKIAKSLDLKRRRVFVVIGRSKQPAQHRKVIRKRLQKQIKQGCRVFIHLVERVYFGVSLFEGDQVCHFISYMI